MCGKRSFDVASGLDFGRMPAVSWGMSDNSKKPATGILFALGGGVVLSVNDLAIKALSGTYALHQVILLRAFVGMAIVLAVIWFSGGGFRQLLTKRPLDHLFRVSIVMVSNVTYFVGLSLMPLADAVATAFVAPLFVTLMSAVILREEVGPRRWAAVGVGMLGVVVMTRPGAGVIQPAAILVLISAFCYASSHMMTRRMRATESAMTLNFFVQVGFIRGQPELWLCGGRRAFGASTGQHMGVFVPALAYARRWQIGGRSWQPGWRWASAV